MTVHLEFPTSPYAPLIPARRWFPSGEALRATAYEKLLPPLVAKVRQQVSEWRGKGYAGASPTSLARLESRFDSDPRLQAKRLANTGEHEGWNGHCQSNCQ